MIHVSVDGFAMVMEVLGLVAGIIGTFVIFFGFMSKKNENRFSGWLGKLYDFLNFKFYIIEGLLKFCYVLVACICTGMGLFMALSIVGLTHGLILLVGGNLIARIAYEFILMLITACRNLGELNKKTASSAKEKKGGTQGQVPAGFEPAAREMDTAARRTGMAPAEANMTGAVQTEAKKTGMVPAESKMTGTEWAAEVNVTGAEQAEAQIIGAVPAEADMTGVAQAEAHTVEAVPAEPNITGVAQAETQTVGTVSAEAPTEVKITEDAPVKAFVKKMAAALPAAEVAASAEPRHRICPGCGEKCSGKFAFCNMCGTKLK